MKSILLLAISLLTLVSCSNSTNKTVRAKDVITNIVIPVDVDTTIYQSGDTIWVNTTWKQPTNQSHYYGSDLTVRLYVLE